MGAFDKAGPAVLQAHSITRIAPGRDVWALFDSRGGVESRNAGNWHRRKPIPDPLESGECRESGEANDAEDECASRSMRPARENYFLNRSAISNSEQGAGCLTAGGLITGGSARHAYLSLGRTKLTYAGASTVAKQRTER